MANIPNQIENAKPATDIEKEYQDWMKEKGIELMEEYIYSGEEADHE